MDSKHVAFPFRWIFPLGQLVLCLLILWPDRYYVIAELAGPKFIENLYQMQHSSRSKPTSETNAAKSDSTAGSATISDDTINLVLPPYAEIEREFRRTKIRLTVTASLNSPMLWVELPFAVLSPTKKAWTPHAMDFRVWRATAWPLVGVVFWWMAGRGVEALVAARRKLIAPRIRWVEVVFAAIIFAGSAVVLIGFAIEWSSEHDLTLTLLAGGGVLWMILTAITITARTIQWRLGRAMSRSGRLPAS